MSEKQPEQNIELAELIAASDTEATAGMERVVATMSSALGLTDGYDGPIMGLGHRLGPDMRPSAQTSKGNESPDAD